MRGTLPPWFFLVAGVVALVAAAIYVEKALTEGSAVRSVIIAAIWVGLGIVWLRTFRAIRRARAGSDEGDETAAKTNGGADSTASGETGA
jgi:hypothetical protein